MWHDVVSTPAGRLVDAMEMYRKADGVVRECVLAELMGHDTPDSYDRIERAAMRQGPGSFDAQRLDVVGRNAGAILRTLMQAGFNVAGTRESARS